MIDRHTHADCVEWPRYVVSGRKVFCIRGERMAMMSCCRISMMDASWSVKDKWRLSLKMDSTAEYLNFDDVSHHWLWTRRSRPQLKRWVVPKGTRVRESWSHWLASWALPITFLQEIDKYMDQMIYKSDTQTSTILVLAVVALGSIKCNWCHLHLDRASPNCAARCTMLALRILNASRFFQIWLNYHVLRP